MKRAIVLSIAVLLAVSGPAMAHCGKCGMGDAAESKDSTEDFVQKKVQAMAEHLGLSEEQAGRVKDALEVKMEKKKAAKEEKEAKMKIISEEFGASLKSILTAEQLQKYESMREEKGSGHEHKGSALEEKGSGYERKGSY